MRQSDSGKGIEDDMGVVWRGRTADPDSFGSAIRGQHLMANHNVSNKSLALFLLSIYRLISPVLSFFFNR